MLFPLPNTLPGFLCWVNYYYYYFFFAVLCGLNKGLYSQSYSFPSSHVQMWELGHKESWVPKNWCFRTVVLEKTLESPLDYSEINPVNPRGNQPWIFLKGLMLKLKLLILWPPDAKSWLIWKDLDVGKDRRREKGTTEDEMVRWYHELNDMSLSKLWEMVKDREAWHTAVHGVTNSWTWLSDWMTTNCS